MASKMYPFISYWDSFHYQNSCSATIVIVKFLLSLSTRENRYKLSLFSIYKYIHFLVAFPVAPGSPVAVEIRQSSVLLEWSYDGDSRQISHFQVERRQFGSQDWTVFGTVGALATTQVNATGLYPFTAYQFRVLSVNNNDVNSPSEPSELVVTREAAPTAAPINVQVVDSNYTAIVVAWEVSILMMVHLLYLHIPYTR